MKGYTVFNVEQIEGLPEHYYGKPQARTELVQRTTTALIACRGSTKVFGPGPALLGCSR